MEKNKVNKNLNKGFIRVSEEELEKLRVQSYHYLIK